MNLLPESVNVYPILGALSLWAFAYLIVENARCKKTIRVKIAKVCLRISGALALFNMGILLHDLWIMW